MFGSYLPNGFDLEDNGFKADEIGAEALSQFLTMIGKG